MEKPEYLPSIPQAILLLLLYFFVFTAVPLLFLTSLSRVLGFKVNDLLVEAVITLIGFILLLFWIQRRYRINYRGLLAVKHLKIGYVPPMLLMTAGAVIVLSEINNWVLTFLPLKGDWAKSFQNLAVSDGAGFWKFILVAVIVAPLVEETIFRGLILRGFIKRYPAHRAIAISALLFGIAHLNPWQFWTGIIWGGISGWWFYETRSLVPCIIGHALLNSATFLAVYLFGLELPGLTNDYQTMQYQPLWLDLLGVGMLVLGMAVLMKMLRRNKINLLAE
jgi:membrane protease YdiL (CAAX protease family)